MALLSGLGVMTFFSVNDSRWNEGGTCRTAEVPARIAEVLQNKMRTLGRPPQDLRISFTVRLQVVGMPDTVCHIWVPQPPEHSLCQPQYCCMCGLTASREEFEQDVMKPALCPSRERRRHQRRDPIERRIYTGAPAKEG